MQPTDLPDLPAQAKTKKELIRDLVLHHPKTTTEEIASQAHTTKQYVWKEKSIMGSQGLLVRRITAQRKEDAMFVSSNSGLNSGVQSRSSRLRGRSGPDDEQYLRNLDISPIDAEGMKTIYREFNIKKKPVEIIAEHGFPPNVVEAEYTRFLRLQDIGIQDLQTFIGNELRKYPLKDVESLEKNLEQNGYLTTDEMIQTVKKVVEYHSSLTTV
jgi:hypothetical protein